MLKIELDPKKAVVIQASGDVGDIVAELGIVINDIYCGLGQNDPRVAEAFKSAVQAVAKNDSPAWGKQIYPGGVSVVMPLGGDDHDRK